MLPGKPLSARGYCYYKVTVLGTHVVLLESCIRGIPVLASSAVSAHTWEHKFGWRRIWRPWRYLPESQCLSWVSRSHRPGAVEHKSYGTGDVAWVVH